jgi:hypothetical protein
MPAMLKCIKSLRRLSGNFLHWYLAPVRLFLVAWELFAGFSETLFDLEVSRNFRRRHPFIGFLIQIGVLLPAAIFGTSLIGFALSVVGLLAILWPLVLSGFIGLIL